MIDAFAELYEIKDGDMVVVDVDGYGFVKLQCYTPSYDFKALGTYTDSNNVFKGFWDEWLNLNLFLIARKMQLDDIVGEEVFNILPKGIQLEIIGRKDDFAKQSGINL